MTSVRETVQAQRVQPAVPWITRKDSVFIAIVAGLSFILENSIGLVLLPLASSIPLVGGTLSAIP